MAELAKTYQPSEIEPKILARWHVARAFAAEPDAGKPPYVIVIPPPNVTAQLHLGHALNNTLQDILVRWHRMRGDNTVWIPGTDHAGIATQTVVEKRVLAEQGKRRVDFQREEFVKLIQAWKDEYEATITHQLKMMGCSCDFERQRFTMDEVCARAVREAFFQLFKDGLIYRGKRLVNWDPITQTALADDEVEMEEVDGFFYYLKYPVVEKDATSRGADHATTQPCDPATPAFVTVATTRPETMLGDTAVAINPKDPRVAALRGKFVKLPIVNRTVPIIEDEYVVLPVSLGGDEKDAKAHFATGFLKVTPAHDENDWLIGQRHHLPVINVLSPEAKISRDHGWPEREWQDATRRGAEIHGVDPFAHELLGLNRYLARKKIVKWFEDHGLLEEVKPYRHVVGHSYRSHAPIEPYLSDQWYVDVDKDFGTTKPVSDPAGGLWEGTTIPRNSLAGLALRALHDREADAMTTSAGGAGVPPAIDPKGRIDSTLGVNDRRDAGPTQGMPSQTRPKDWQHHLQLIPERYERTFESWHENIRDWCISRQLWWGHRIPVWSKCGPVTEGLHTPFQDHIAVQEIEGTTYVCLREDHPAIIQQLEQAGFTQDPDVLDTWFSSALWPISTLGWPHEDNNPALQLWNPSSTLCTAREIITLWVSRMVMFNLYLRGCLPFEDVFIHAMIQDGEGRKMSKSLGNGVDPLDIIHSHGADALRFTLAQMTTQTQDVRMPVVKDPATGRNTSPKFDLGRNFSNKIWNATRFALTVLETRPSEDGEKTPVLAADEKPHMGLALADQWILARLARLLQDTHKALEQYQFSAYAQGLYDFFWRDLCDWYIEAIKPTVAGNPTQRAVLGASLDTCLRLMHPVMPFLTETLWEHFNTTAPQRHTLIHQQLALALPPSPLLIHAAWPHPLDFDRFQHPQAECDFELVREIIIAIRQVRTQYKVVPKEKIAISAKASPVLAQRLLPHRVMVETLANVVCGEIGPKVDKPAEAAVVIVAEVELHLHGLIQADAEKERLQKRRGEVEKSIANLQGRLKNPSYVDRAPAALVKQTQDQLAAAEKELAGIREQLNTMGA